MSKVYILSDIGYLPTVDSYGNIIGVYSSMKKAEEEMSKYILNFLKDVDKGVYGDLELELDNEIHGETYSECSYVENEGFAECYITISINEFELDAEV